MSHRCRDKACRKHFSVRTHSVMARSHLGYQQWVIAIYLQTTSLKSVSSMKLHRDLGITQKSAWFLAHRLRETWEKRGPQFTGPVEADETYMGGKRRNMSKAKRKELKDTGRGTVGKTAVIGIRDRATKQVRARVAREVGQNTVKGFIHAGVKSGATVYTDDAKVYQGLRPYRHETVNHSREEYVRGDVHTNGIEGFWSMFKRAHKGAFHKMSEKHLDRYVQEFAGRQNMRSIDTIKQMAVVTRGLIGKRLTYADLIADNGLDSGARE